MVVEADESDGTFTAGLPATIAIVTETSTPITWSTGAAGSPVAENGFHEFVSEASRFLQGLAVCCTDHPERAGPLSGRITDRRVMPFGFNAQVRDVRAVALALRGRRRLFSDVALQAEGNADRGLSLCHARRSQRISNALAPRVAVGRGPRHEGGPGRSARALAGFCRRDRRFTKVGRGRRRSVIDDYGETIPGGDRRPCCAAARQAVGRRPRGRGLIGVHQPHPLLAARHSLFEGFPAAASTEAEWLGSPRSTRQGEAPIPGASRDDPRGGAHPPRARHARGRPAPRRISRRLPCASRPARRYRRLPSAGAPFSAWAKPRLPERAQGLAL